MYLVVSILLFLSSCLESSESVEKEALYYLNRKEYELAIPLYKKAIQLDPNNISAIHDLGRIYKEKGFYEAAIHYYSEAIEIDKSYTIAYNSCGFAYYKLKQFDKALDNYHKALKLEPNNGDILGNVATIYEVLNEFEKARIYYYESLKYDSLSNSINYGIMVALSRIEFDLGNYNESAELCYKIIGKLEKVKDAPHGTLGLVYMAMEKYDSAIVHLNKAIEYNPNWCHYYNNRGYSISCLGDENEALKNYNKAIEINPTNPNYFLNRADSKRLLGLYREAIEDYNTAIELSKEYEGYDCEICFQNRAMAKLELGDEIGYQIDIKKAKELGYPENYNSFSNLEEKAKFYSKKKEMAAANKQDYERSARPSD